MSFRKSSHFQDPMEATGSFTGTFDGEFTGSASATFDGEFTGSATASVTGAVAVLSSPWAKVPGAAAGTFDANLFTLTELSARFGQVVNELLVFVDPLFGLPQQASLQLYYDTSQQGDISIIEDVQSGENMTRIPGGNFTYTASPPSVALSAGIDARNASVPTARIRLNDDGIQTLMILMKPNNITNNQYAIDYGNNGNTVVLGFSGSFWEFIIGAGDSVGDDPRLGTQIPATASVFQTVCYTIDVDGANKMNGYLNGSLSVGPLNKTFDLVQPASNLDIGHVGGIADFTGEFGAYLQWTTTLTAAEVAEAHNFLRNIDAGYGLPEA